MSGVTTIRILVVDDHPVVRRGIRALLESQTGWEVTAEASNGREAVEKAAELHPDIVVMDLTMPELNGLDAARQILTHRPQTEILVLTMHHSEELAEDVLKAGARGYLLKSDADERLITAVESLRQHKPFFSSDVAELLLDSYIRGRNGASHADTMKLTPREREVVQLVAEGKTSKEIAATLDISVKTVDAHRTNIMRKLRLQSVSDLVRYAIRNKIVQP